MAAAGGDRARDRYAAAPPATLRIERLDALTVIHHRPSGLTHLVDSPVPELIALMHAAGAPMTLDALLDALGAAFELADPDPAALAGRLDELVAAGLVERQCAM